MRRIWIITMLILVQVGMTRECSSQSKIDIHDLVKQRLTQKGAKEFFGDQKVTALLPVHNQIMMENENTRRFITTVIIANTVSIFVILVIVEICKCGCRRMRDLLMEIEDFRTNSQTQNQKQIQTQQATGRTGE